jgi:hypothetical protein
MMASLGLLLLLNGCGYYSFTGASAGHLRSVAVPPFENRTAEFGIAESLTQSLIDAFTVEGTLKVRGLSSADAVLYGTVVRIDDRPSAFTADETVEQYKVTVTVRLRFEDRVKGKVAWEESMSQFGLYPTGNSADRQRGIEDAMEKLSEDILSKTVSGW